MAICFLWAIYFPYLKSIVLNTVIEFTAISTGAIAPVCSGVDSLV